MLKWTTLSTFIIFFFLIATTWGYTSLPVIEIGLKDGTVVNAEVAASKQNRERGLMYHEGLGEDEGMLFVFDKEDKYPFWMKGVDFPKGLLMRKRHCPARFTAKITCPVTRLCTFWRFLQVLRMSTALKLAVQSMFRTP
jgi:hypothetical protein